jgi:hypothetical protein
MPGVGFDPTITAFERAKAVHALDCAATVTVHWLLHLPPALTLGNSAFYSKLVFICDIYSNPHIKQRLDLFPLTSAVQKHKN